VWSLHWASGVGSFTGSEQLCQVVRPVHARAVLSCRRIVESEPIAHLVAAARTLDMVTFDLWPSDNALLVARLSGLLGSTWAKVRPGPQRAIWYAISWSSGCVVAGIGNRAPLHGGLPVNIRRVK